MRIVVESSVAKVHYGYRDIRTPPTPIVYLHVEETLHGTCENTFVSASFVSCIGGHVGNRDTVQRTEDLRGLTQFGALEERVGGVLRVLGPVKCPTAVVQSYKLNGALINGND